jgi:nicotinamidase-related amidase
MELNIRPQKTALLVIDMQADFYAPNGGAAKRGKPVSKMQEVATKINQFISEIGGKVGLVVFTRYLSGKGITPQNLQNVAEKEKYNLMCEKGSGLEELSGVSVSQKAIIIDKPHFDAFAYTNLLKLLKDRGIETVLITGVRTEICVDATAKRTASEGFAAVIVSDLVATYDDKNQVQKDTLAFFDKYYGYVADSTILTKLLN